MTDDELEAVVRGIAPVVREYVAKTIGDLLPRLAVAESKLEALGDVRDRMVAVETKAAIPVAHTVEPVTVDLSPLAERIAVAEARLNTLGDLRDSVVQLETKAAVPPPPLPTIPDLVPVLERLAVVEHAVESVKTTPVLIPSELSDCLKDLGTLRERVAVMEVKGQMPGPAGKDGDPGKDGKDGKDGEPGLAGLSFEGVYQDGKSYDLGNLVTWAGSSWHCNEPTTTKPGDGSKAWTLMVKRGRDGKDGVPGADGKPGRDITKEASWRS